MNMNPQFFYLLNLVMITRLGFCFKDQPITLRRAVIMSFIQFFGLFVLQFNYKLFILMFVFLAVNIVFYFIEKRNKNINGLRVISFFIYFIVLDFFCSEFIQLDFNKVITGLLGSMCEYSLLLSSLSGFNWVKFNILLSGFLMIINEVNFMIRYQFQLFELIPRVPGKTGSSDKILAIDEKEYNAGRIIGILERILIFIFVLENQYGGIGLVLVAKGFTRFKELDNRNRAEYVLIGTLLSTVLAIIVALITKKFHQ